MPNNQRKKYLNMWKIYSTRDKILNNDISTLTFKNIVVFFIEELLGINIREKSIDEIKSIIKNDEYIENLLTHDLQEINTDHFYREFCKNHFHIVEEPCVMFFKIRKEYKNKIQEIKIRLKDLFNSRDKISPKTKIPSVKNIENYKENYSLISFFIENNKKELKKYEQMLIGGIEQKAVAMSIKSPFPFSSFFSDLLLNNSAIKNLYLELSANFFIMQRYGDMPIPNCSDVVRWFEEYLDNDDIDRKDIIYYEFPDVYIKDKEILKKIKIYCSKHHILKEKQALIEKCIDMYNGKEYILLGVFIPTLIESLINDVCIMYKASPVNLYNLSLPKKIDFIQKKSKNNNLFSLDYFRYFFPAVRNHLVHGWVEDSNDMKVLAGHLILDLNSICNIVQDANYKMNTDKKLIYDLQNISSNDMTIENLFKFLEYIKLELAGNLEVDDMYNLVEH